MGKIMPACADCGMVLIGVNEYHPYAACLMYKASKDEDTVRKNLLGVLSHGTNFADKTDKSTLAKFTLENLYTCDTSGSRAYDGRTYCVDCGEYAGENGTVKHKEDCIFHLASRIVG